MYVCIYKPTLTRLCHLSHYFITYTAKSVSKSHIFSKYLCSTLINVARKTFEVFIQQAHTFFPDFYMEILDHLTLFSYLYD